MKYIFNVEKDKGSSETKDQLLWKQNDILQNRYTASEPKQIDDLFIHSKLQPLAQPAPMDKVLT